MGGRGIISIEYCVTIEINSMNAYIESSNERMLKAVHREKVLREKHEGIRIGQRSWKKGSKDIWITEPFHGQFFKNTEEVRDKTSCGSG